jgi:hypothetical protein
MIANLDQEYRIQNKEGWSHPSGSASFGAKVALSLNGVDPSFMNSVAGSYLVKPSCSNILDDSKKYGNLQVQL